MTEPVLPPNEHNLIWIDLEMTGLSPATDRIIEIAVVVTDANLNLKVEGPVFAIHQSDETLDKMDNWNKGTHGKSGLIDRVKASTITEDEAVAQTIASTSCSTPRRSRRRPAGVGRCADRGIRGPLRELHPRRPADPEPTASRRRAVGIRRPAQDAPPSRVRRGRGHG